MIRILFIVAFLISGLATTTPVTNTGGAVFKEGPGDVPCTPENTNPDGTCNIVWGT